MQNTDKCRSEQVLGTERMQDKWGESASGYVSLDKGKISELNFRSDQDQVRSVAGQNRITAGRER